MLLVVILTKPGRGHIVTKHRHWTVIPDTKLVDGPGCEQYFLSFLAYLLLARSSSNKGLLPTRQTNTVSLYISDSPNPVMLQM